MNSSRNQVESYYFGNPDSIATKILFIKRKRRLAEYKPYLTGIEEFGNVWHGITGWFHGEQISVVCTGVGPSLVGDAVYALNRPHSTCLYSGTCGGLAQGLEIGDYFVADQALCGDGFSFSLGHAPLSVASGNPDVLNPLATHLVERVGRVNRGMTFTTSSVVREADPEFWNIVDKQCQAIEMGAAALYAAAQATDKRAAAYFWVTDLPRRGKSFFDSLAPEDLQTKQDRYDRAVSLDIELLAGL